MRKRRRSAAAPNAAPRARRATPILLLIAAIALTAWDAWAVWSFWERLPARQYDRARERNVRDPSIAEAAVQSAEAAFEQARILATAGETFVAAARNPATAAKVRSYLAESAPLLTSTQLGRAQQALAALLEVEKLNLPIAERWGRMSGYLVGLERASFAHLQSANVRTTAAIWMALGADAGTALQLGRYGQPMGPFLQIFTERMRRTADECAAAGMADATNTLRSVQRRMLKQWVLDEGPAGLRVLAAELLARELSGGAADTGDAAIVVDLRAWRAAFRDAAARLPVSIVDIQHAPMLAPREYASLVYWMVLTLALCGGVLGAATISVFAGWAWFGRIGTPISTSRTAVLVAALPIALLGLMLIWLNTAPGALREDVRRVGVAGAGLPRHPLVMAGIAALGLAGAAACLGLEGWRGRLASAGRLAVCSWVVLGVLAAGACGMSELARRRYERVTAAVGADDYGAIAGDQTALLTRLRAWTP